LSGIGFISELKNGICSKLCAVSSNVLVVKLAGIVGLLGITFKTLRAYSVCGCRFAIGEGCQSNTGIVVLEEVSGGTCSALAVIFVVSDTVENNCGNFLTGIIYFERVKTSCTSRTLSVVATAVNRTVFNFWMSDACV
jgi:hypothetical protein